MTGGGFSGAARRHRPLGPFARGALGRLVEVTPGASVLDVEAGTGLLAGTLHRAGRSVVAAEADAVLAAELRRAVPVPVVVARADALPFRTEAFNVVVSGAAGRPPVRDEDWWAEVGRVTRSGGAVLVVGDADGAPDAADRFDHDDGAAVTAVVRRDLA